MGTVHIEARCADLASEMPSPFFQIHLSRLLLHSPESLSMTFHRLLSKVEGFINCATNDISCFLKQLLIFTGFLLKRYDSSLIRWRLYIATQSTHRRPALRRSIRFRTARARSGLSTISDWINQRNEVRSMNDRFPSNFTLRFDQLSRTG